MSAIDPETATDFRWRTARTALIIIGIVAAMGAYYYLSGDWGRYFHKNADQSSQIAEMTGASGCFRDGYQLIDKIDGSKTTIYDCTISGSTTCVTEENGIASDVTAEVKLLFANTLGADQPQCIA